MNSLLRELKKIILSLCLAVCIVLAVLLLISGSLFLFIKYPAIAFTICIITIMLYIARMLYEDVFNG